MGRWTAIAMVIGAVIGSGIFLKANVIAAATQGHWGLILFLWVLCGMVNLCGALTLAELATMMPHAGGTYVYLREAYGSGLAFFWGWAELTVIRSGAIAALAAATMISVKQLLEQIAGIHLGLWEESFVAVGLILVLAWLNVLGTRYGGFVQNLTTLLKVIAVGMLAILPFWGSSEPAIASTEAWPETWDLPLWQGIGLALAGIMWTYDGWGSLSTIVEEIEEPAKNVPWSLVTGVGLLIVLYFGANLGYHLLLPWEEIAQSQVPAMTAMGTIWPEWGGSAVLGILIISIVGALNANIIMGPRVLFAMSRDGLFFPSFAKIDPRSKTPARAIWALSIWSAMLILLGTLFTTAQESLLDSGILQQTLLPQDIQLFDLLTSYCIFGGSLFYLLATLGVFILRKKQPDAIRPYRTWGYPWVPAFFVFSYALLVCFLFAGDYFRSLIGLSFIAAGWPLYLRLRARKKGG
ncbi:Amino acid permease-associated region [Planctomycetales bacterium 10988]|nr:Amino acid permease-associated region [Planctomycetales bacterium 10988]